MSTNISSTLRVLQRLETLLDAGAGAATDEYIPFPGEFTYCVDFSYKIELNHESPEKSSLVLRHNKDGLKFGMSAGMLFKNQSYYKNRDDSGDGGDGGSSMFRSLGHLLETEACYTGQSPEAILNVIQTFSLFLAETNPAQKECKLVYGDASAFSRIVLEWSLEYDCIFNEVHDLSSFIILDAQV
jgi:hypothetical protein